MEIAESPHLQGKGIPTIKTETNDVKSEFPDPNGPQSHPGDWNPYYNQTGGFPSYPPAGFPPYPPPGNPPGGFPPFPPPGQMYPGQYPPQFDPNYGPPWNAPNYYLNPPAWPNWGMPVAPNPYGGGVNPPAQPGGVEHIQNGGPMSGAPPSSIEKPGIDAQKYGKRSRSEWETDESLPKNWKKRSFEINHSNTKSGKATMFEYLSPSNQIYPSRSKMAEHMRKDGRYSQEEIDKVERSRKNYMSSGIQQKNLSTRFTEWETDAFLPAGWKKRSYQNNNRNTKTGKMTKYQYLNPEGQIIPSRIQVIDHMVKSGIYSQEDIIKVKEGKSHRRNNEMMERGNNEGREVHKYESNPGGYSNNQMNQSVDSALGNSMNTSSHSEVNNSDPRETYKNEDHFRNPPNQWDQSNYINNQNNQLGVNPPLSNPTGISTDVKNENLLKKFPGVSFTKYQESASTTKVTPIANDSRDVKDTFSLIKNLPGIAIEQVTENPKTVPDGSTNENNLIKSSDNFVNAETTFANYQNSLTNDNIVEKKRRKVERSEWEIDDSLPYGWKRRSYDNSWNRNGEKYSVTKYEYMSPSEKMFNTRIKVLEHMLELPAVYSEEHILNFQNSQKKVGKKAKLSTPDGNVKKLDPFNDSMEELAYIAEHFYPNSESPNVATDYTDTATDYKPNEIPKATQMYNYVPKENPRITYGNNSGKADEKSSQGNDAKDNTIISSFNVTEQKPILENASRISEKPNKLNDYEESERCSDKIELQKNNDMNKITNVENHSLKPFKELLIGKAEESINDNAYNSNISFDANEFINSTEKSSNYEGIASYNNSNKDSKNDEEPIEGYSNKMEINKVDNIENPNLKPLVSAAENDNHYNTDVSFNANEFINSTEIGNISMNDSKEWSEKLSNENRNYKDVSPDDCKTTKVTEEVYDQSGNNLLESTEVLVQVNNDFGKCVEKSENLMDFENSDSSYSLDSTDCFMNDSGVNVEKSTYAHEVSSSNISDSSYGDADLSNVDFLEKSKKCDPESNNYDKGIKNDICDDTEIFESFSDDLPKASGQSNLVQNISFDNSRMSLDSFCDDSGMSNSDFSEICNGDISDKTENSEQESDNTEIEIEDFSDYSEASDDISDNSSTFNDTCSDNFEISDNSTDTSKDHDSNDSEISNDTPSEYIETLDGSSEPPKQMEDCVDIDDSNRSEMGEDNSFPNFMGPTISMNVSDFSMIAFLFIKNPNPSRSMVDDMSEDMEIDSKDIKWTFIKLRAKFQEKKGHSVNAKPVEDLVDLIKTKYGKNSFTF